MSEADRGLLVLRAGLATTVQDRGRPGHREYGVPVGGAFDLDSLMLANALLGNDRDAAALELTMIGGEYRATRRLALALAGAPFETKIGALRLRTPSSFVLDEGDVLAIGGTPGGLRGYLAVAGGWRTSTILSSRSSEVRLKGGDILPAGEAASAFRRRAAEGWPDPASGPIRLLDGPDGPIPPALLQACYRVAADSDRVGLRLEGPEIAGCERPGRASAPVAAGAVQVAGGRPIILGVAGGTMGGYPHVAHVISADLDRLGQAGPGLALRFVRVDLAEAVRLGNARCDRLASRELRLRIAIGG